MCRLDADRRRKSVNVPVTMPPPSGQYLALGVSPRAGRAKSSGLFEDLAHQRRRFSGRAQRVVFHEESGAATLAAEPERASALRRSGPWGGCFAAVSVHADFRSGGGALFGGLPARYATRLPSALYSCVHEPPYRFESGGKCDFLVRSCERHVAHELRIFIGPQAVRREPIKHAGEAFRRF